MKLTTNQLINIQASLIAVAQVKVPSKVAYIIKRALDKSTPISTASVGELQALYRTYGVLNEEKTQYIPPTDPVAMTEFQVAWDNVQQRVIEIDFMQIPVSALGDSLIEACHLQVLCGVIFSEEEAPKAGLKLVGGTDAAKI